MTRLYPLRLPIKRNQMEAIGHVTIQWAFLETEVDMAILEILTRLEKRGRSVKREERYMRRPFKSRVSQLRKLTREYFSGRPRIIQKFGQLLDTAVNLRADRNNIVHGRWRAIILNNEENSNQIIAETYSYDARKVIRSNDYSSPKMRIIAQRLSKLNRDFFVLVMMNVGGAIPPSPGTYALLKR